MAIGQFPENIPLLKVMDSIGETIVIADQQYNVTWMNSSAAELLSNVAPLFGFNSVDELIGVNMGTFHRDPVYQEKVMENLKEKHRARITIRDEFAADIVITPILCELNNILGYVVMLMDVTTKAEEERKQEELINELSIPTITIWNQTIALPLKGKFDKERADRVLIAVLEECVAKNIRYVLIDLSGLVGFENETQQELQKLYDCLRLIGTECILVGIKPELAQAMAEERLSVHMLTFQTAYSGLQYIMDKEAQSSEDKHGKVAKHNEL